MRLVVFTAVLVIGFSVAHAQTEHVDRGRVLGTVQAFLDTKLAGGVYTIESKCEPSPLGPLKQ